MPCKPKKHRSRKRTRRTSEFGSLGRDIMDLSKLTIEAGVGIAVIGTVSDVARNLRKK